MAGRENFNDEQLPTEMHLTVRRGRADEVIEQPFVGFDEVRTPVTIEIPMTPELREHIRRLSGSTGTRIAERGTENGTPEELSGTEMRPFPPARAADIDAAAHNGRRTRSGWTTSSVPREPDPTTPEVLLDGRGRPVITPSGPRKGLPMLRPAGLDPNFFIHRGRDDKTKENALQRDGGENAILPD